MPGGPAVTGSGIGGHVQTKNKFAGIMMVGQRRDRSSFVFMGADNCNRRTF